jgi:hypothetical protein
MLTTDATEPLFRFFFLLTNHLGNDHSNLEEITQAIKGKISTKVSAVEKSMPYLLAEYSINPNLSIIKISDPSF